jgi:hypothetical protein
MLKRPTPLLPSLPSTDAICLRPAKCSDALFPEKSVKRHNVKLAFQRFLPLISVHLGRSNVQQRVTRQFVKVRLTQIIRHHSNKDLFVNN